ncbi:MAG TPA: NAD(P)/FAD-dependent oxidoreductase [Actinomycetota bacterium]|nr:NAD(P)/FAD-dependent oxidoreductase [Actinomycetota bacterium]
MTYDVIVIGAGAAGEAAYAEAARLGARVAVVERDLVGGECSFWACMPSKTLLDSAGRRSIGGTYPWSRASDRRDWMISREGIDYPSDSGHVKSLEEAGADLVRGDARIVGPGKVEVRRNGENPRTLEGRNLVVSTGSVPVIPPVEGLKEAGYWTSREATSTRELPSSIVIMGGGPVGVEMAQVFVRFDVETTLVEGNDRILARDHPLNSQHIADQLKEEGLDVRTGVHAAAVRRGGKGRIVELSDGSSVEGAEVLVSVGRRPADLRALGTEEAGVELDERGAATHDDQMRVADGVYIAGDVAGGLQFTHVADYEGQIAARAAVGQRTRADLSSVPRCTYTYPPAGAVGWTVPEAQERGIDAVEFSQDFSTTARGYTIEPRWPSDEAIKEGSPGHVTVVVDRERMLLVGAFAACTGAPEFIHEAVLGIKLQTPLEVLADTIRAFPAAARVFGNILNDAWKQLS